MKNEIKRIGEKGSGLIFLISQPRAGSTMLQKILSRHAAIRTVSEPWVALQPLYALKKGGLSAEYDADVASQAVDEFVKSLPGGEEDYFESARRMLAYLYSQAITGQKVAFFLDKTPRYYHIIPELYRLFPDAKFIFLLRNPLAVLNSMLDLWCRSDLFNLSLLQADLIKAPALISEGMRLLDKQSKVVKYEKLLFSLEEELRSICAYLDLEFDESLLVYGDDDSKKWNLGDPDSLYSKSRPDVSHAERWVERADEYQRRRLLTDYLQLLGEEQLASMGYSYHELREKLRHASGRVGSRWNYSLPFLLAGRRGEGVCSGIYFFYQRVLEKIRNGFSR